MSVFHRSIAICPCFTLSVLQYVRVSQVYCSLPLFHTKCTAVCSRFSMGVLQYVRVSQVYCSPCFTHFHTCIAVCPCFTPSVLQAPFYTGCTASCTHFTLSVLQSAHNYVTLSILQFYGGYLMVLSVLQPVRVSHRLHCTVYAFQTV